jgi:hypothetical protein
LWQQKLCDSGGGKTGGQEQREGKRLLPDYTFNHALKTGKLLAHSRSSTKQQSIHLLAHALWTRS